jgi:two-component system, chemotaxis family, chemotaxis protein CheY
MSINPMNVLVIDDFKNIRIMLKTNLYDLKVCKEFYDCSDAQSAWSTLEEKYGEDDAVELIICDLLMPKVNGIDFLKQVRSDARFKHLPFIMLSSENQKEVVIQSIQEGVSTYLLKPWTKETLLNKIKQALKGHE